MTFFSYKKSLSSGLKIARLNTGIDSEEDNYMIVDKILSYCRPEELLNFRFANRALNQQIFIYSLQMFLVSASENRLDSIVPLTALKLVLGFKKALFDLNERNAEIRLQNLASSADQQISTVEKQEISVQSSKEPIRFKREEKTGDYFSDTEALLNATLGYYEIMASVKERLIRASNEIPCMPFSCETRVLWCTSDDTRLLWVSLLGLITFGLTAMGITLAATLNHDSGVFIVVTIISLLICSAGVMGLYSFYYNTSCCHDQEFTTLYCVCKKRDQDPSYILRIENALKEIEIRQNVLGFSQNITNTAQLFRRTATPPASVNRWVYDERTSGNELPEVEQTSEDNPPEICIVR